MLEYSYCEPVWATGVGNWHIRELTDVGRNLGGGIDTTSLCGLVSRGWDLASPVTEAQRDVCHKCSVLWAEAVLDMEEGAK